MSFRIYFVNTNKHMIDVRYIMLFSGVKESMCHVQLLIDAKKKEAQSITQVTKLGVSTIDLNRYQRNRC